MHNITILHFQGDVCMEMIFIFILGLLLGSFLNVCIYRLPLNQSVSYPSSQCIACKHTLDVIDLIPLVSWLCLKGKCRYCNERIPQRYIIVELLTAFLFVSVYLIVGWGLELVRAFSLISFLIIITYIDYDYQLILNKVLIAMGIIGVSIHIFFGYIEPIHIYGRTLIRLPVDGVDLLMGFILGGSLLFLIMVLSRGSMGGGDVKFAAVLGLWFGWQYGLLILFIAFMLGGLIGTILIITQIKGRKDYIPFAPFIAVAALISYLYGTEILQLYFYLLL